jgi:hypothetical protein
MKMRIATLVLGLALTAMPAGAVPVAGLYEGDAFVTGQDERERPRGLRDALGDVLVKVSGDPMLLRLGKADPILARAPDFVLAYQYEDRMKHLPLGDEQGTRDRPYHLTVQFDPAKVDAALAKLGYKPFGADRPAVLVVLWVKTAARAYGLARGGESGVDQRDALTAAAFRRGVPLVLPAEAQAAAIDQATVEPLKQTVLAEWARQTQAQAVLSGTLVFDDKVGWRARWHFSYGAKSGDWRFDGVTFDEAMRGAMDGTLAAIAPAS